MPASKMKTDFRISYPRWVDTGDLPGKLFATQCRLQAAHEKIDEMGDDAKAAQRREFDLNVRIKELEAQLKKKPSLTTG